MTQAADRWAAWDRFLESVPEAGFMQASWWADFRGAAGFGHFGLTLKQHGTIVGGAMVLKFSYAPQSCFYYIPEGPVLPHESAIAGEVFEAILADIESHRRADTETVSHLRIEPRWEARPAFASGFRSAPGGDRCTEPRRSLLVDLRLPESAILAQMKPKGRYNIRVAERHGVAVIEDTSVEGIDDFCRIYEDMTARQRIEAKPPEYFEDLLTVLVSAGKGSMFFAEYQRQRIAAAVVVYFGGRATYFYGASLDAHRNVMAPYLLHFEIMRRAKAIGCEWYDLWGIAPPNEPDHRWTNITTFKRKFGGREIDLVPTLDYVYDPAAYERYVEIEVGSPVATS